VKVFANEGYYLYKAIEIIKDMYKNIKHIEEKPLGEI
jgi:hypothetical protein